MENNLDFATNGVSAPHTYSNTSLQGSSDLDYQPISSRPTPPAASANDTKDQAARLRALLSSHLSEGGSGNSQATGADRLEALIDMLYAMTAPAEAVTAAAPVAPEEKPAPAPVAEAYTITLPEPISAAPIQEPLNVESALASEPLNAEAAPAPVNVDNSPVEATLAPASAPVEVPTWPVLETAPAPVSEDTQSNVVSQISTPVAERTETAPPVVAEAQTVPQFAAPEAIEALQTEVPQAEAPPLEVPQAEAPQEVHQTEATQAEVAPIEVPQEQAQLLETTPTTEETTVEPAIVGETFPVQEPQLAQEPAAFLDDFIEDSPTVFAVGEAIHEDAKAHPRASVMTEVLTMDERTALLNPLKEERTVSAGNITFNFVTDKSTATLNIPMQANLSQITFEQRLDEIILKIHLSL